jgi:hypothetical protein
MKHCANITPLTLEVKPLSQTRECVHLKEQPEGSTAPSIHCTVKSQNQVILKLYLARVKIVCASAPEGETVVGFKVLTTLMTEASRISCLA